jgi:hypothetical protein
MKVIKRHQMTKSHTFLKAYASNYLFVIELKIISGMC